MTVLIASGGPENAEFVKNGLIFAFAIFMIGAILALEAVKGRRRAYILLWAIFIFVAVRSGGAALQNWPGPSSNISVESERGEDEGHHADSTPNVPSPGVSPVLPSAMAPRQSQDGEVPSLGTGKGGQEGASPQEAGADTPEPGHSASNPRPWCIDGLDNDVNGVIDDEEGCQFREEHLMVYPYDHTAKPINYVVSLDAQDATERQVRRWLVSSGRCSGDSPHEACEMNGDASATLSWCEAFQYCVWAGKRLPDRREWGQFQESSVETTVEYAQVGRGGGDSTQFLVRCVLTTDVIGREGGRGWAPDEYELRYHSKCR